MAERRMIAKAVVQNDSFISLSGTAQGLYMQLLMLADDDGFIGSKRMALYMANAKDSDLNALIKKNFVIRMENDVLVITHWHVNNLIRKDRYKSTVYVSEKNMLEVDENGRYVVRAHESKVGQPMVNQMTTVNQFTETVNKSAETNGDLWDDDGCEGKVRLGKDRLGEDMLGKDTYSTEPEGSMQQKAPNPDDVFINLPLNRGEYPVLKDDVEKWKELYPAVDVEQQLRNMYGWLDSNRQRRKTERGINRFITNWLSKEQDKGRARNGHEEPEHEPGYIPLPF